MGKNKESKDYTDIKLKKEKRANWFGKWAVVFLLIGVAILGSDRIILALGTDISKEVISSWIDNLFVFFYIISTCLSFIGFCIGRTKMTKAIFLAEILCPVALVVGLVVGYAFLYFLISPLAQLAKGGI